ncbi:MAG: Asp-tRNA(Asn)/Glu-tRNA(Gln) amidotransferase subunit GatC [bacterium]|nr:Asp-tRNA(Asn)/Glu-tRNA(Gln) amidotransferase subunit GatC [bacterium]
MEKEKIIMLAKTAFVSLNDEQTERFLNELEEIVRNIENTLDKVNLKEVPEGRYFKEFIDLMPEDAPERKFDRETMMMNAKKQKNSYILVPKLIKEDK